MNFGEKLKRLRTERNLTQPQFAEAIGIEQSYLSKLENDKSLPSAEMFSSIISSLALDPKVFLSDIDRQVLQTSLRHIPEVSQFLNGVTTQRVHDARKYWYSAAAAGALGFALMLAANDGIFYSNKQYKYTSQGVILQNESDSIFDKFKELLILRMLSGAITEPERARLQGEFETERVKPVTIEIPEDRGSVFFQKVDNGQRKFELNTVRRVQAKENRILQYLGALFAFCSVLSIIVEWRLRKLSADAANQNK
jgi:transcriptional regulator with XRE-family HTH domain